MIAIAQRSVRKREDMDHGGFDDEVVAISGRSKWWVRNPLW